MVQATVGDEIQLQQFLELLLKTLLSKYPSTVLAGIVYPIYWKMCNNSPSEMKHNDFFKT